MNMKRLTLVIFAFFLAACDPPRENVLSNYESVIVWHDDQRSVTCWIYNSDRKGGIFCMTDREINGK